jgi:hypothetical protein
MGSCGTNMQGRTFISMTFCSRLGSRPLVVHLKESDSFLSKTEFLIALLRRGCLIVEG